jgi:hypothetical protein
MTEITAPQQEPENPLAGWQPRERKRRLQDRWALWLVFFAGLSMLCLVVPAALVLFRNEENGAEWEGVADEFMCAMRDGKVAEAFAMFASGPEKWATVPELQDAVTSNKYVLFDGYEGLEMTSWNQHIGTDGNFVTIEGNTFYGGSYEGTFTFVLVKQRESWRVYSFYVWVPWDKMDAFEGAQ